MDSKTTPEQNLLEARSRAYGRAFSNLDHQELVSWHSKATEFQDIAMQEFDMDRPRIESFFFTSFQNMKWLRIVEQRTTGSLSHCSWEMLIELEYAIDEPIMGISKGQKAVVRGVAVMHWVWEGEGSEWDGNLADHGRCVTSNCEHKEKGLRGWKIKEEHDYMLVVAGDAEAARARFLERS